MTGSLTLEGLTLSLDGRCIARLDLTITGGQIVTLMAPSGAGKSSILAAITGTLSPRFQRSGRILLDGKDISHMPTQSRCIGLLFQDPVLFPHMSVSGNLAFALPHHVKPRAARAGRIAAALASAGLAAEGERDPATLSGGQKARIALLRTLLAEPKALLLDEPFSRLDADLRAQVRQFTFDRAKQSGIPTLMVTHDAEDARQAGGPVIDTMGQALRI